MGLVHSVTKQAVLKTCLLHLRPVVLPNELQGLFPAPNTRSLDMPRASGAGHDAQRSEEDELRPSSHVLEESRSNVAAVQASTQLAVKSVLEQGKEAAEKRRAKERSKRQARRTP